MSPVKQPHAANESVLLRDDRDGVVTLTLNRPAQFNALSAEMLAALQASLDDLAGDEGVRCVVLGASGGRSAPAMTSRRCAPIRARTITRRCSPGAAGSCRASSAPNPGRRPRAGPATAAGCQLVASCDLAVAAESARFAVSGIDVGLFCSTPAVALSRNVS